MPLITHSQPTYSPAIFEPDYVTGEHGVVNPLTGSVYGAFGLTVIDYEKRSAALIRLSDRTHCKGSAYSNKQKFVPLPEPDLISEFPPEDTRGIIAVVSIPETISLQSGIPYDLTVEILLGNKTPTDLLVNLEALDLNFDEDSLIVLSQDNFLLPSGTEAVVLMAVKLLDTATGQKTIQINGETDTEILVYDATCVLDLQPMNPPKTFYSVNGPESYTLTVGDPVDLAFTTSNGMAEPEVWEFNDPLFLQAHNLTFSESGVLMSTGVTGLAGTYQVTVFVEQIPSVGPRIYASKILEITVA